MALLPSSRDGTARTSLRYAILAVLGALVLAVPLLNALPAPGSSMHLADFYVNIVGKWLCLAILALSIDLIWGFCGILSLGAVAGSGVRGVLRIASAGPPATGAR